MTILDFGTYDNIFVYVVYKEGDNVVIESKSLHDSIFLLNTKGSAILKMSTKHPYCDSEFLSQLLEEQAENYRKALRGEKSVW